MKHRIIVFDFDGVIIDSNQLKFDAFFQIFPENRIPREIIQKVLERQRERTRFKIIEAILKRACGEHGFEPGELQRNIHRYAEAYNRIVEQGAIDCREIPGIRNTLEELSNFHPLYINSATPIEPLRRIVSARGLSPFFREIYGGPAPKSENLRLILQTESVTAEKMLFVGDAESDAEAAATTGCCFIGLRNAFNRFSDETFDVIDNIWDLPGTIHGVSKN
ncbi:MAG: HAD hydrolase-like protein [Deltaproteobacteria bacterium]|nr:HAD hydrolase-like protein [Deltaproteobacteria bacterium]